VPQWVLVTLRGDGYSNSCPFLVPNVPRRLPDTATFCPNCGSAMQPAIQPVETRARQCWRTASNVAGALAYCTILPAIVFLLVEPYNKSRFVRFHSFQCIGLWFAALVFGRRYGLQASCCFFVPLLGHLVVLLLSMVVSLGFFVIWVVMIVKALQERC